MPETYRHLYSPDGLHGYVARLSHKSPIVACWLSREVTIGTRMERATAFAAKTAFLVEFIGTEFCAAIAGIRREG